MTSYPVIVKASGEREHFIPERLNESMRRAGATPYAADRITDIVTRSVVPGASSHEIYRKAFALLRKEARPIAARYAMRRALLELGPTGHPFEDLVSHLFQKEGWSVETRKIIKGKCVPHEVDFYAKRGEEFMAAELKYHNDPGYKSDLKTALYVKSRFDDIFQCDPTVRSCPIDRGLLVTNTKFTSEAIAYATCAGVELLGWNYPETEGLFVRLTRAGVYPITALTTLSKSEKLLLIGRGIIAADQLRERRADLVALRFSAEQIGELFTEADGLLAMPA